jgi:hypothetical protein
MKLTRAALSEWWNRAGRSVAEQSALVELLHEPGTGPESLIAPARMTPELWTAVRDRAAQIEHEARQQAEADAPFKEADRLADAAEAAPNYRRQITSDRAARVMREIGDPLARDARASGPELTDGELDREIDRLAQLYPEPGPGGPADPGRYLEAGQ